MHSNFLRSALVTLIALTWLTASASAAPTTEVCGDGIDNDGNGIADDGCYPSGVTGVCESPLSCAQTGAVAPLSGQLVYHEPPDISPTVPYGPSIAFQRFYMSKYQPGYLAPSDTNSKAPLGYGWHHNFMSWLTLDTSASPDEVIVHTVRGQDVLFTLSSTLGGYDSYTPQAGFHFDYVRQDQSSPNNWEIRTLSGVRYLYDSTTTTTARLTAIVDSIGNTVAIKYNSDGQVEKVTDASGFKYLWFSYNATSGDKLLDKVEFFTKSGSTSTLRTTIDYVHGVEYQLTRVDRLGGVSEVARSYTYSTSDELLSIADGEGNDVAKFRYLASETGKVARIETASGTIGYGYNEQQSLCIRSGSVPTTGTCVYYHNNSNKTCAIDSGASFCGGETTPGTGSTGTYFRATRWLGVDSPNEDLISSVASSCPSCSAVDQYDWDTGTAGEKLELDGTEDALGIWTSYEHNSNGLLIKRVENDDDSDASTSPSGSRTTYYLYGDTNFPGNVTEVRRLSELKPGGTCTSTTTTDCKRTLYVYSSSGQAETVEEVGFTYNNVGVVIAYSYQTEWSYDSLGRHTQYRGPRTDTAFDVTDYTYHSSANELLDGYPHETKRQTGAGTYLVDAATDYDFWGNAVAARNPNNVFTCLSYHQDRNTLTERRTAMAGQTSCASVDGADLIYETVSDRAFRPTQTKLPLGNCLHYQYDSWGRVSKLLSRDDCNIASAGDSIEYEYSISADGMLTSVDYKDASGVVRFSKSLEYEESRRLLSVLSPGLPSTEKAYSYHDDGRVAEVEDGKTGLTEFEYDNLGRVDLIRKYLTTSTTRDWSVTSGTQHNRPVQVSDPAGKDMNRVWDDMGRKVKQDTPDAGITLYNFDAMGNLTMETEDFGGADQITNTYVYDSQNRVTEADYGDANCFSLGGSEIEYTYDSLSGCPTGTCTGGNGKLIKVETQIACDNALPDDSFDQQTFYGYDNAGRVVAETIQDDSGRNAPQEYEWDKNGKPTLVQSPSGTQMAWDHNYAAENSDMDKIIRVKRNDGVNTYITTGGYWNPFGPMKSYRQYNKISGSNYIRAEFSWDNDYRPTKIHYRTDAGVNVLKTDITWDDEGNLAGRDYTGAQATVSDAFYNYDGLDRVVEDCDISSSSCISTNEKSAIVYDTSGVRTYMHHDNSWGDEYYYYYYSSGTNKLNFIYYYEDGWRLVDYHFDGRGNRLYDDDNLWATDRRDYTYDARNNLITVQGKMHDGVFLSTGTHDYTLVNSYDHKNRRIFKGLIDDVTGAEAQWFFYYDLFDRLIEIKHVPDVTNSSVYSLYQYYWIGQKPIAYWQVDYPSATTTKRYFHSDDQNRPHEVYSWDFAATRQWSINPDLFGWDKQVAGIGSGAFQPLRFPGQFYDEETVALKPYGGLLLVPTRPGLHDNMYRVYDPFTGSYLQADPKVGSTWDAYKYASQSPAMNTDPTGLLVVSPDRPSPTFMGESIGMCFNGSWHGPTPFNPDPETGGPLAEDFDFCNAGIDDGIFGDNQPDPPRPDPPRPPDPNPPGGSGPHDPPSSRCLASTRAVFNQCFQAGDIRWRGYDTWVRCIEQATQYFHICDDNEGGLPSIPPMGLFPGWVSIFTPIPLPHNARTDQMVQ